MHRLTVTVEKPAHLVCMPAEGGNTVVLELVHQAQDFIKVPQQAGRRAGRRMEGQVAEDDSLLPQALGQAQLLLEPAELLCAEAAAELAEAPFRDRCIWGPVGIVLVLQQTPR